MTLLFLIARAAALSCDSDSWDPFEPLECNVVAVTPGPSDVASPTGVITVITTDGCTDLTVSGGGIELVRTYLGRPSSLTANTVAWKFALSGLPLGQTEIYLRNRGHHLDGFPVTIAEVSASFPASEPSISAYTTAEESHCDTGGCCTGPWTEAVATLDWFLPGVSAPGWTARLLDENEGFLAELPLGGQGVDQFTTLQGPTGSAPACIAVALHDPYGDEHTRTPCFEGAPNCGCASDGSATGAGLGLGFATLLAMQLYKRK